MQADVRWCEKVPKLPVARRDRARLMDRATSRSRHRRWPTLRRGRRGSGGIVQSQMCPSTMRLCMPPPRAAMSTLGSLASFPALCCVPVIMHPLTQEVSLLSDTRAECPLAEAAARIACVHFLMTAAPPKAWSDIFSYGSRQIKGRSGACAI